MTTNPVIVKNITAAIENATETMRDAVREKDWKLANQMVGLISQLTGQVNNLSKINVV